MDMCLGALLVLFEVGLVGGTNRLHALVSIARRESANDGRRWLSHPIIHFDCSWLFDDPCLLSPTFSNWSSWALCDDNEAMTGPSAGFSTTKARRAKPPGVRNSVLARQE